LRENLREWMPSAQVSEESLGAVVVSCRNGSQRDRAKAMGTSHPSLMVYPAVFMLWIMATGGVLLALKELHIKIRPQEFRLLASVILILVCVVCLVPWYRRPRKPLLVLYERGFRYRKSIVNFDDLTSIRFGRELSRLESFFVSANPLIKKFFWQLRAGSEMAQYRRQKSLTLVFRSGETETLRDVLFFPLQEDMERFLLELRRLRPGLLATG